MVPARPRLAPLLKAALVALAALVAACNARDGGRTGGQAPPSASPQETPAPSVACDALPRAQCLASRQCTLHFVSPSLYACRPSEGPCEVGLDQDDRRACESRAACVFEPGSCYCPFEGHGKTKVPDTASSSRGSCRCSGGPPSRCRKAGDPPQPPR
jgi:hypothetical protein